MVGVIIIIALVTRLGMKGGVSKPGISGGGAIIVGPIPIIFGTSSRAVLAASIIAAAITVILILLYLKSYSGW